MLKILGLAGGVLLWHCTVLAACPEGYTAYLGPDSNMVRNSNGECVALCASGVRSLNTSDGGVFDLFAAQNTAHSLNVQYNGAVCYADLKSGAAENTLNIQLGTDVFHTVRATGEICPQKYTLSYSCGDGATGTPPDAVEMAYGDLYTPPYAVGTCRKSGYYLSGWKVDSVSLSTGNYYSYTYNTNKTMVAQWASNSYGAPYICNYCDAGIALNSTDYVTGRFAQNFTVKTAENITCSNPMNMKLDGWDVYDSHGNPTGETLAAGATTQWKWNGNVQLRGRWSDGDGAAEVVKYTLSYSCGDGATGTPPASQTVAKNQLYTAPFDAGTCRKPGYYLSGWKIDSTSLSNGNYYNYTYGANKTMVAQWSANSYGAPYLCNNGTTSTAYLTGRFNASVSPDATKCTAADDAVFAGYKILDAWGNDTGTRIASGESFVWQWPSNIQLQAIWE